MQDDHESNQEKRKNKPTMMDVARLAGVSQSTVSFIINDVDMAITEDVKKRVYSAIDTLKFTPRSKIKNFSKASDCVIALFVPTVSNIFYPELIKHLEWYAIQKGYRLLVVNTNRDPKNETYFIRLLMNIKVAGIVYGFTPGISDSSFFKSLAIPVVVFGEAPDHHDIDIVNLNSVRAGEVIADHLAVLGHRSIAYLTSPMNKISLSRKQRLEGVSRRLRGVAELQVLTDNNENEEMNANYELDIGESLAERLVKYGERKATAIIAANDMIAIGAMRRLKALGIRIPQDMSVCGFDNIVFSDFMSPSLTTVDHCTAQRSRLVIDTLDDKITRRHTLRVNVNYEPQLLARESTGSPPAGA